MDMAWIIWGLLSSFGLILSPVCVSAEQQQSQSGFRRLYVLQPGPGPGATGAGGGVRVSSISTRHGAAGQPHTYNVELTSSLGGQVRTRRMGSHAASTPQLSQEQSGQEQSQQRQLMKLSGVNVCGGHCCHGWSKAQGSQRCTKLVCHLPCINGGKCSARDKCQCPPSFTGKFCQMPIQNGHQQHQQTSGSYSQTQVHSTHTLPLTYSNGQSPVFSPSIVNIHIKHPPEASVQVHQVSQLDNYHNNGHQLKGSQSGSSSSTSYRYHHTESSQNIQHHGYNIVYPSQHGYQVPQYQPVTSKNTLGRCFQETAGSQCGKALPGLTKQEQCCGTIGTSWGFQKCQKCPKKPSIPLIDCPEGYKRINSSHCQDLDECQLQGVCPNGNCLNTMGSYRCHCKPGYVPDPTLTMCIFLHFASVLVTTGGVRRYLHPIQVAQEIQLLQESTSIGAVARCFCWDFQHSLKSMKKITRRWAVT